MRITRLLDGYRRFRDGHYSRARSLYQELEAQGQSPKVLFLACCDSRVDPAVITDAGPGELFVVRNVANLVPPCNPDGQYHGTSAALEFAIKSLGVEHIVVMGHAQCGGAKALLQQGQDTPGRDDFIGKWMHIASAARDRVYQRTDISGPGRLICLEQEIVRLSLRNLLTFEWIKTRVEAGTLHLHGWYFGIAKGRLYVLDPATDEFRPAS